MPEINFTIPDSSPIITYSPVGAWGDSDAATEYYTNKTFHFTNVANATASFSFVGTGVSLHGAKRGNHDFYTVTLDGKSTFSASSHTDDPVGEFNVTLYERTGLPFGEHTIQLANTPTNGTAYVDLDWVNIITGDNDANTPNNDIWLDNTSKNFTWDDSWRDGTNDFSPEYYDSTFSLSNTKGGKASLTFYGNAVALYGATSSNHGGYSVTLDNGNADNYNGSQIAFRPQQLLYLASGLKTGQHTITLINTDDTFIDVDYAIVSQYGVKQGTAPPPSSSTSVTFPTSVVSTGPPGSASSVFGTGGSSSATSAADHTTGAPDASPTSAASRTIQSQFGLYFLGALALSSFMISSL